MTNMIVVLVVIAAIVVSLIAMAISVPACPVPNQPVQYEALMPVYGPGKQAVMMTAEGPWTVIRVVYDGTDQGEIVRFNASTKEIQYPSHAPDGWRGGGK